MEELGEDYTREKYASDEKAKKALGAQQPDETELNRQLNILRPMFDKDYKKLSAADKFVLGNYYYVIERMKNKMTPVKLKCTDVDASGKKSTLCLPNLVLAMGTCMSGYGDKYDLNDPNTEIWSKTSLFGPSASTFKAGRSRKGKRKPNRRKTRRYKKNKKSRRK
jgi:hypothetical protein